LAHDLFADKLTVNGAPLEDRELVEMWARTDEECHFRPEWQLYSRIIKRIAWGNPFHPVRDYLDALTWDGVARIDRWLHVYGGAADTTKRDSVEATGQTYLQAISSIVLIAAVRRIRQPGCKYDEMVILESPQGFNKSTALHALCPRGEWFSDDFPLNLKSKELIEATLGKWIIEASDLSGKRKAEVDRLKAMLSRQTDGPVRKAYGYLPIERPRHFILIGTTNSAAYLNDPTGGRRFWPVRVKSFDVKRIMLDRDQLWAEAAYREAQNESIRLDKRLWLDAAREQEKRREVDPWEDALRRYLLKEQKLKQEQASLHDQSGAPDNTLRVPLRVPTSELWDALHIPVQHRDRVGALRIAEIMQRFGFRRQTVRPDSDTTEKGYVGMVTTKKNRNGTTSTLGVPDQPTPDESDEPDQPTPDEPEKSDSSDSEPDEEPPF
jgi:predicted P-loop ATPase